MVQIKSNITCSKKIGTTYWRNNCKSIYGIYNKSNEYKEEQNNEFGETNNPQVNMNKKFKVKNLQVKNDIYFKCPNCKILRHINVSQ